jgi:hypothetical protein
MMHGRGKSDSAVVAAKPTNKAVPTAAEPVERRARAKWNASQQSTDRAQNRTTVSQALAYQYLFSIMPSPRSSLRATVIFADPCTGARKTQYRSGADSPRASITANPTGHVSPQVVGL